MGNTNGEMHVAAPLRDAEKPEPVKDSLQADDPGLDGGKLRGTCSRTRLPFLCTFLVTN